MEIRPAMLTDVDSVAHLLTELRGMSVSPSEIHRSLQTLLTDTDRSILLAISNDGQPLGMIVLNIVHHLPEREVRFDEVVVAERARGRGCGTALIRAAEVWARDHDGTVISFTSRSTREAANHLYQKLGYTIHDTNVYKKMRKDFSD